MSTTSSSVSTNRNSSKAKVIINEAKKYTGTKYKYGGLSKSGIDCSGLVCQSYAATNMKLPRTSTLQSNIGKRVYIGELQPADLIFFSTKKGDKKMSHVGIISYVSKKEIRFYHASSSRGVMESVLSTYWRDRYVKATRPLAKKRR
ncbi:MAG: C40 family peptidase [Cyclobacteriaceae bacterium]